MESVKQMQHSASSHCSLLRHTELFMKFCCQCVFAICLFFSFFFFFPIQFKTCFIFYNNLFLLLSFGEPGIPRPLSLAQYTHVILVGTCWDSKCSLHCSSCGENPLIVPFGQPPATLIRPINQRWQRALELRRLFT